MPIEAAEWNSGKIVYPLKQKILVFLQSNIDKAFDIKEIIEGTGYSIQVSMLDYGYAPESRFRRTLEKLAEDGFVEIRSIKKTIGQEFYYKAISQDKKLEK